MSDLDKNKIFFGMVKYILSEQKNVDWVFKTSVMSYSGAKQSLTDTTSNEIMNNMIQFIYEIKPYHVQFSDFQAGYEPSTENINVEFKETTSFKPVIRFDNVSSYPSEEFMEEYNNSMTSRIPMNKKWLDTTLIERYCYLQSLKDVYLSPELRKGLPTKEEMKDLTRSDFKGVKLKGGDFLSDVFGYDMLMYDTDQYDSPTVIYDYCVRDMTEPMEKLTVRFTYDATLKKWVRNFIPFNTTTDFTYIKNNINAGETNFSFEYDRELDKSDLQCVLYKKNTDTYIIVNDYNFTYSGMYQLQFFIDILDGDTLYIKILQDSATIEKEFVYNAMAFTPQDSYNIKRKIIPLEDPVVVDEPEPNIVSKRLLIVKQTTYGYRSPFLNYVKDSGKIKAYGLQDGEHIILSAYDYQYLYDVIVKSSDVYGRSNNTIIYSGGGLLRPHFEAERPGDLCVSHCSESLIMKSSNNIRHVDFKGKDSYIPTEGLFETTIKDVKKNEQGVVYAFSVDKERAFMKKLPVTFLIGSELLTASKYEDGYFTSLMRCKDGTHLIANTEFETDIDIGMTICVWRNVFKYEPQNITISYMVKSDDEDTYIAPLGSTEEDSYEISILKSGEGIPVTVDDDEFIVGTVEKKVIGNTVIEDNVTYVYSPEETILYAIEDDGSVYEGYLYKQGTKILVGIKHGKYIETLDGTRIATLQNGKMSVEFVSIKILATIEKDDVIHISAIHS